MAYLDSAASAQRCVQSLRAMEEYHLNYNANIHRGVYSLSERATAEYESVRQVVSACINGEGGDVVFTKNATEALNLVAHSLGAITLRQGDVILISEMEHHANIVPWQLVAKQLGCTIVPIPVSEGGEIIKDQYQRLLEKHEPRIVALCHVSNVLGTINPIKELTQDAKRMGAKVVVDGSQAVHHIPVDLQDLGVDMYVFTGHKVYGPTGVGVLWGRRELLREMPPYQGGGDMIDTVTFEQSTYAPSPTKFEAGTPPIAAVIGLGAALSMLQEVGMEAIMHHEKHLSEHLGKQLKQIGAHIYGHGGATIGLFSFTLPRAHPHDIATILGERGVYVRAGQHCAEPLMRSMGVLATTRISLGIYNTDEDIALAIEALEYAKQLLT